MAIQTLNNGATLLEQRTKINENFVELDTRVTAPQAAGVPLLVSASLTIDAANQAQYHGRTLECTAAVTLTLSGPGLTLSFAVIPPASGDVSLAFAAGATGNGAATTLTRSAAANPLFAVQSRATASTFIVTGF
jgi:hypothetical protein